MKIDFWKMHGAGNDFILVDNRDGLFPRRDINWLSAIGQRHTGIGCEGIILLERSDNADFRMRFLNPDGNEVDMCGNGARCAAKLASDMGIAGKSMRIETGAGILSAFIIAKDTIKLEMTAPTEWRMNLEVEAENTTWRCAQVNTGVPHVVINVEDINSVDVDFAGAAIRNSEVFQPQGTNVNFMNVFRAGNIAVRTYERGVEAETPACGTGAVACALMAAKNGLVISPATVFCRSGAKLVVEFTLIDEKITDVTLTGPAEHVFKGIIEYPTP